MSRLWKDENAEWARMNKDEQLPSRIQEDIKKGKSFQNELSILRRQLHEENAWVKEMWRMNCKWLAQQQS